MAGSIACTACRKSHLKCDLQRPICSRCVGHRLSCTYLPSRRGGRRVPRDLNQAPVADLRPAARPTSATATAVGAPSNSPVGAYGGGANNEASPAATASTSGGAYAPANSISYKPANQSPSQQPYVPEARLVHLYYTFFHQAHPILVPATFYNDQGYPDYVHQLVRFIGSHYSKVLCADDFLEHTSLLLVTDVKSPTLVQALLLFSIMMSVRNNRSEAVSALSRAVTLALELGMYRADYAGDFANSNWLQTESLRRTWWELLMWEIYLAIPNSKIVLRCSTVKSDAYLPCEESIYASPSLRRTTPLQTFSAFRARLFDQLSDSDVDDIVGQQQAQSQHNFSSYSYRIEAFHILARVLVLNTQHEIHPDHLQSIANMIVSWGHLLPASKVDVVDRYGNIDEMLFQAQFIVHYASALLHVSRSNLRPRFPAFPSTICPETPARLSPSLTRHTHDVKAIGAAKELSNLLSIHSKPQGYSPSMVPGTVLSGLVQLAAAEAHGSNCFEHHQNRAVLVLATLSILKKEWPIAEEAYRHVKTTAATVVAAAASVTATSYNEPDMIAQPSQARATPAAYGDSETQMLRESTANQQAGAMDFAVDASSLDAINKFFLPGLLSPHIEQTCGESPTPNYFVPFD